MAFSFAPAGPDLTDTYLRVKAGMPVLAGDEGMAMPALPQAAAQPAPVTLAKPSAWDVLQGVLFNGQSPADAAMAARQRNYQVQTMQRVASLLPTLPKPLQAAAMMGGPKVWEEIAKNYGPQTRSAGQQTDYMGGVGQGGYTASTGTAAIDDKSGVPTLIGPDGNFRRLASSLGGGFSAKDGVIASERTGDVANTYSLPQILAPGSIPNTFTPSIGGASVGATTAPGPSATRAPASATSGVPRGLRNNNFGNVKTPPSGPWQGQTGTDEEGHAIFADPADGVRAARMNLQAYAGEGINTPAAIAARWKGVGDASAYGKYLAGRLGVKPTDPIDLANPATQQQVLRGIFDFENGPQAMASWRGPKGAGQRAGGSAPGFSGPPAKTPMVLDPADPGNDAIYKNVPPGTLLQRAADGTISTLHEAEFSPSVRAEIRGKFMSSDPYNQHIAAASALAALQHNIGQMTGPAAYTILDTMARTINPGAVARQGTISAIEGMLGVPAHVVGGLQNYVGEGKIPLSSQQAILNAVTPFAQSHYDEAKRLYDANAAIAKAHKLDPNELTAPLGERPAAMFVSVPPPAQRQAGALYVTPKGPMKWTGRGWLPAN